jgi:C-terminal processing protease CtpA/Prc
VVIVDEVKGSRAETIAEILSLAPRATVVGSTTAGVPGGVANISLPGNLRTQMTVLVRDLADPGRGIIPDVEAKPTIAGIRAGRDEVLEEALHQILGPDIPAAQIQEVAK